MPTFISDLPATVPFEYVRQRTVGSDHAPIALRANWQALRTGHEKLGVKLGRCHGLLSDGTSALLCEKDEPLFFSADRNITFLRPIRGRPFIELSCAAQKVASASTTVFRDLGNITPPRAGRQTILIRNPVEYGAECYGADELNRALRHGLKHPIVLMIENHRSGLVRRLMEPCPFVIQGFCRAGFAGGWL